MNAWLLLAALSLPAAAAAPPSITYPEEEAKGIHGADGLCSVHAFDVSIDLPSATADKRPEVPESWKRYARDTVADARARLMGARRLLDRMQLAQDGVVAATNRCDESAWEKFVALSSAAQGAVMDGVAPALAAFDRSGEPVRWERESYRLQEKGPLPVPPETRDRYAGACRAPDLDADLYAPDGDGLPASAQPGLAAIGESAARVTAALIAQKEALDALLPLLGGRRCREILRLFDDMTGTERRFYFEYRERAVAAAVWDRLKWHKAAPPK